MSIKVIVAGFKGRMGSTAVDMIKNDSELELAALLDPFAAEKEIDGVPVFTDKSDLVGLDAEVWVDFTNIVTSVSLGVLWATSTPLSSHLHKVEMDTPSYLEASLILINLFIWML